MGARLVTQALHPAWAGLSDPARLVLIAMCQTAKDKGTDHEPPARYWAGRDWLALILTGHEPTDAARQRVKRAIRELVAAGAVEQLEPAHRGRNAIYLLTPGACE